MSAHHVAPVGTPLEPPVRGERVLRALERPFAAAELFLGRFLPERLNPLLQTGALTNLSLAVAVVTGIVVLVWYTPSTVGAWPSVSAMGQTPWGAGLVRTLHRVASDAAVLFATLHAARLFVARRFTGARWLAWVTGWALVALLWFDGWLGYWLVWDERARQVAVGTARMFDGLPIFADPFSRGFLADASLNSLLFFVVFFLHMLLPLPMAVALWLHIARVQRSRFWTATGLTAVALVAMVALSRVVPADLAGPARMAILPGELSWDAWYLLPVLLTDRLPVAALWALGLGGGALVVSLPWLLGRGRAVPAVVDEGRCNGCRRCATDCPYGAIRLDPRPGGPVLAVVDPSACVGCGVCAGACDSAAISIPPFPVLPARRALDASAPGQRVALVCEQAEVGPLDGFVVQSLPCSGWMHPLHVERAARHGAAGVLVVTCAPGACRYREGADWIEARLAGVREPALRPEKVTVPMHVVSADRAPEAARAMAVGRPKEARRPGPVWLGAAIAVGLAAVVLVGGTRVAWGVPRPALPELVVSFKHPGAVVEDCRQLTDAEKQALPVHMRRDQECGRARAAVRLVVTVDGVVTHDQAYPAKGLWGDGNSVAVAPVAVPPGEHRVEVTIEDGATSHGDARTVSFVHGERRVVLYDRNVGFGWH